MMYRALFIAWLTITVSVAQTPDSSQVYAWYKGDAGVSLDAGGNVLSWANQATTGTPSQRDLGRLIGIPMQVPMLKSGGVSTQVMRFGGAAAIWSASSDWAGISGDRTLVFHLRLRDLQDGFLFDGSTSSGMTRGRVSNGSWQVGIQPPPIGNASNSDPVTTGASADVWQTHTFTFDDVGGQMSVFHHINGVLEGSHTLSDDDPLNGFIMAANVRGQDFIHADIAEVLVYDRALNSSERAAVQTYLNTEWSGLVDPPMSYQASRVEQSTRDVSRIGVHDVARLVLETAGDASPFNLTNIRFDLAGTTDLNDVSEVRLYASGLDDVFDPSGTVLQSFTPPYPAEFGFSGSHALSGGENSFWIAVVPSSGATIGNRIDARVIDITVDGPQAGVKTPVPSDPTGDLALGDVPFFNVIRKRGDEGVHTYRIPGLVTTPAGTLIASFDLRYDSSGDLPGNIDVGIRRSTDGGVTWGPMQVVMDYDKTVAGSFGNGVGDATLLVDRNTGRVYAFALWSQGNNGWNGSGPGLTPAETGQLVMCYSDDDGLSWTAPVSITPQVKDPTWRLFFNGPGKGITTRDGLLILPTQYRDAGGTPHAQFIWSDDQGATWQRSSSPSLGAVATTESQIVELNDGSLLSSMRNHASSSKRLWTSYSWNKQTQTIDQGAWSAPIYQLDDPTVMASVQRYSSTLDGQFSNVILFSNPHHPSSRTDMTIHASTDEGVSWAYSQMIDARPAAYSCMTVLDNGDIGILYETGDSSAYEGLTFARFPLSWVVGETDSDSDGMSDFYEDANGLNKNVNDATGDADGDGYTNLFEAKSQTRASDPESYFSASYIDEEGSPKLRWQSVPRVRYCVEQSTDLNQWDCVVGMESLVASSTQMEVALPANGARVFYRVKVLP